MIRFLFIVLFLSFFSNDSSAQPSSCPNLDFETGTLANWTGYLGWCCPITVSNPGMAFSRQTIMSGGGFDPHSLGQIPVVAPGGGHYSVRLGNDQSGSEAEMLQYTVSVTNQSDLFIYRYAVVLEDPSHNSPDQPRFEIRLYDQLGQNIQCGVYNVVSSASIPGFQNNVDVRFKTWTTVGIDLSAYIGQNVTIEFRTGDCALGAHFGYAYLDCYCGPLQIRNGYCPNSLNVTLEAPEGFASYLWSTGATTSSIVVPTANIGLSYSCVITSVTGCSVTLSTNLAQSSIDAGFRIINNCQNTAMFSDTSTTFNSLPALWNWDFGDGSVSNFQNPTHVYSSPGMYTVQLISESDAGCKDTATNQVLIWPAPVASANTQNVCEQTPVSFINTSTIAWGSINSCQWTFSDGATSTAASPQHIFPGIGNYSAQLITTSDLGCLDTLQLNFIVNPNPVITAGPDVTLCGSGIATLGDLSNPILDYQWAPLIGVVNANSPMTDVTIPEPTQSVEYHTYYLSGRDIVNGCASTDSVLVIAKENPDAAFETPPAQCFKGNSFDLSPHTAAAGATYQWFFSPQAFPVYVSNPSANGIRFSQPGVFPLMLLVENNGCADSTTGTLRVVQEPEIQLAVTEEGCPPLAVNFQSIVTPAGPLEYQWNFSDNTVSTEENPVHVFTIPGMYSVSLNVTDPDGCSDNVRLNNVIHVLPVPDANFTTDKDVASIIEPHFSFQNYSQNGYLLNWDFGDATVSYDFDTYHTYEDTGHYIVMLIMQNSFGCNDTSFAKVFVEPYYSFYVPDAFTPNGDGVNDYFRGLGMYIKNYEMWIYNRWGKTIYFTSDYNSPWDGKGDYDTVAQNEVYDYLIKITDSNLKPHQYIGHVTLVR